MVKSNTLKILVVFLLIFSLTSCEEKTYTPSERIDWTQYSTHGEFCCGRALVKQYFDGDWDQEKQLEFAYIDEYGRIISAWYEEKYFVPSDYKNDYAIILADDVIQTNLKNNERIMINTIILDRDGKEIYCGYLAKYDSARRYRRQENGILWYIESENRDIGVTVYDGNKYILLEFNDYILNPRYDYITIEDGYYILNNEVVFRPDGKKFFNAADLIHTPFNTIVLSDHSALLTFIGKDGNKYFCEISNNGTFQLSPQRYDEKLYERLRARY